MGISSSGARLDLVGLTSELKMIGFVDDIKLQEQFIGLNNLKVEEVNMSPLSVYMRYLDDTEGVFEVKNSGEALKCILRVGICL